MWWDTHVLIINDLVIPLHSTKVCAPCITRLRWYVRTKLSEVLERDGNTDRPATIDVSGIIQCAVNTDCRTETRQLMRGCGGTGLAIRTVKAELPSSS